MHQINVCRIACLPSPGRMFVASSASLTSILINARLSVHCDSQVRILGQLMHSRFVPRNLPTKRLAFLPLIHLEYRDDLLPP